MTGLRRFLSRSQNLLGLAIVLLFLVVAIEAPRLAPHEASQPNAAFQLAQGFESSEPIPPNRSLPLGTVPTGALRRQYNIFYTVVWGTRSALRFGLIVTLSTAIFGILVGASSAYFGGFTNNLIMRITDAFLSFPLIAGVVLIQQLLSLTIQSTGSLIFSDGSVDQIGSPPFLQRFLTAIDPVMLAFILFSWMAYARIINSSVLGVKQADFVQAARALGASHARIIVRHLIPNTISPAIVLAARDIGGMVLLQATFTFIGMGGNSEWGALLVFGRKWIIGPGGNPLIHWWVFVPATLALVLFGIGWNLLGDGLNDWLNPRTVNAIAD